MLYEGLAITILDTMFPQLAPFIAVGDALYHALNGDASGLANGATVNVSIKGRQYTLTLQPK